MLEDFCACNSVKSHYHDVNLKLTMENRGFWENLKSPIIGLAPMDGVTDAAFRYILAKHGKPAVMFTEFTNVEGLARGAVKMLKAFFYDEIERPVVAQIYGVEVESYYKCAVMLCEMGFDGIDINMGCPAKAVASRGAGAGLIRTPELAQELIRTVKRGVQDWSEGITMKEAGVHEKVIREIEKILAGHKFERKLIPVSVKTRTGYDKVVAEEWVKVLMEERPANITMHGRTLKQMYSGQADWEVLAKAAAVCKGSGISFLGNGDIRSMEDAVKKVKEYDVDGVLIGRAAMGNPWFFIGHEPSAEERITIVEEHCLVFEKIFKEEFAFHNIKKHLAWYLKGFEGVKEMRMQLMQAQNFDEVRTIMSALKS